MAVNIVFEGIESSGKTTLSKLLTEVLLATTDLPVISIHEPGGSPIGRLIRHTLLNSPEASSIHPRTRVLLYSADRNETIESVVKPFNEQHPSGISVGDRSWASTFALQSVDGAEGQYIFDVQSPFIKAYPTKYFLLDLHEEEARIRLESAKVEGREINWRDEMDTQVYRSQRMKYLGLAKMYPQKFVVMDGFRDPWSLVCEARKLTLNELAKDERYRDVATELLSSFNFSDIELARFMKREAKFDADKILTEVENTRIRLGAPSKGHLRHQMLEDWQSFGLEGNFYPPERKG